LPKGDLSLASVMGVRPASVRLTVLALTARVAANSRWFIRVRLLAWRT